MHWLRRFWIRRLEKVLAEFEDKRDMYHKNFRTYGLSRYYWEWKRYEAACDRMRAKIEKLKG